MLPPDSREAFVPGPAARSARHMDPLRRPCSKGHALDLKEAYPGVRCVGVAVSVTGWPVVHIRFSLPLQRSSVERLRALAKPLMGAAREIEKILAVTPRA